MRGDAVVVHAGVARTEMSAAASDHLPLVVDWKADPRLAPALGSRLMGGSDRGTWGTGTSENRMPKPSLVRDIMTREVVTLYEEDNLLGVEEGMRHFRFRHLPVVDDGKLVGLITERDLLRVAASITEPGER